MGNKLSKYSNTKSLIGKILEQPGLTSSIQNLDTQTLEKLIEHIGLEDSGEIIALTTSDQLERLFDSFLWKSQRPGKEEQFDVHQFSTWLNIMLEMGVKFAAQKILTLDEDFLIMALSSHIFVIDIENLAIQMSAESGSRNQDTFLLEKALEDGLSHEFEEYRIISKNSDSWDAILTILIEISTQNHHLFRFILDQCHQVSSTYIEDNGGLYHVLNNNEQIQEDASQSRELRREKLGYVSPSTAVSFFALIRNSKLNELEEEATYDVNTRLYFKQLPTERLIPRSETLESSPQFINLLKDAGIITPNESTLLIGGPTSETDHLSLVRKALEDLKTSDPLLYSDRMKELNYVANSLISGVSLEGRKIRPREAAEISLSTCNLGIEHTLKTHKNSSLLKENNLIKFFKIGWSILFNEVSLNTAHTLSQKLLKTKSPDPWINQEIESLRLQLEHHIKNKAPWLIQERLIFLESIFDAPTVKNFIKLLEECPSFPNSDTSFEFISCRRQIDEIQSFLNSIS